MAAMAATAWAQQYTAVRLDSLVQGYQFIPIQPNNKGQVAGWGTNAAGTGSHVFLFSGGAMVDLGPPPGRAIIPGGVFLSDGGQIAGNSANPGSNGQQTSPLSFFYGGGNMINLGPLPGGTVSYTYGINAAGQVIGTSDVANGGAHAFLYSAGHLQDLGTLPGGSLSFPVAINGRGQVIGYGDIDFGQGPNHAFLYSGGALKDLGTLAGGTYTIPTGLNNSGQVVGYGDVADGSMHAFLYSDGIMRDLGTLTADYGGFVYINDNGQVAWTGGSRHGLLYSGGIVQDLGLLPGGTYSSATATDYVASKVINNSGQVVGEADVAGGTLHAFRYSDGILKDLGAVVPVEMNSSGQVSAVGRAADGNQNAFLYSDGRLNDLNDLVTLPSGDYLTDVNGFNDAGYILASTNNGASYLLTPAGGLTIVNPFANYAQTAQAPPSLPMPDNIQVVTGSAKATSLAADGQSAVVLAFQSKSSQPVTFSLSASGTGLAAGVNVGSMGTFDPQYLVNPNPQYNTDPQNCTPQSCKITTAYGPDSTGTYTFLALLWGPAAMPMQNQSATPYQNQSRVNLAVTATQQGQATLPSYIALEPPPLLLIHGVWSSAKQARFAAGAGGFNDWISGLYAHKLILAVDYGPLSAKDFGDSHIQNILLRNMTSAIAAAAESGMAARSVDVVAHSMGGLVTRYFLSQNYYSQRPVLGSNPVHSLITIGTPHLGSNLAAKLDANATQPLAIPVPMVQQWCAGLPSCTLQGALAKLGKQVGAASKSLEPNSMSLQAIAASNNGGSNTFRAIVGDSTTPYTVPYNPPQSTTEKLLDLLIGAFVPGQTVLSLLNNEDSDTIVPVSSQNPSSPAAIETAVVPGAVHTNVCADLPVISLFCQDTGETADAIVWAQAYWWLTGGAGQVSGATASSVRKALVHPAISSAPAPVLDLSGYTLVAASNATLLPATGSVLTINSATNISATSSTKTITELLLLQTVTDPADTPLLYATQSPFSIPFVPARLGATSLGVIVVFSDNTYATTTLNYTFQPSGAPYALNLVDPPAANMTIGDSITVEADASFANGPVDVTQAATYTTGSGSTSVFSASSGGTITANGNGTDLLVVSYQGVTATAPISVGACSYTLNPSSQIVPNTGGTVTIQVATQSGCAWTASIGSATWLFTQAGGNGNGNTTLSAPANNSGSAQLAAVTLGGREALLIQPATACSYGLSQTQIAAPAAGTTGVITVTTSCPIAASSNQSWMTATLLGASVPYAIAPNTGAQRTATLAIGTASVPVTQSAAPVPAVLQIGKTHTGNFTQGQANARYMVTVSNSASDGPTSGTVTVTETVPSGLTLVSMTGTGWTCPSGGTTCTRSDSLPAGASYPPITVNVNVASTAPGQLVNQVSVSGGGSAAGTATDTTNVVAPFTDVDPASYYATAVDLMREYSITAGCGTGATYCPGDNVTRAQMAIFIIRSVMGGDNFSYSTTPYFTDVPSAAFGFAWIQKMYELGITTGCGSNNYCPNDNVTRDQMAVFIIRARYGAKAAFTSPPAPVFSDVPSSEPYFPWIQRLAMDGITAGCGNGQYCPAAPVIRADMAIFIIRGAFNQLLPASTAMVTQISPATLAPGATGTFAVMGSNTHFVQGTTTLAPIPGVTIGTITVTSATSLTVQLTAAGNAVKQPDSIVAITGGEQAVLPNGLSVK